MFRGLPRHRTSRSATILGRSGRTIAAMAKTVRIGSGLGFYGDAWEPVMASIERGGVQYIASDHLAELTLAILQKDRQRDASLGWARDVVPMLSRLWPAMQRHGARPIVDALRRGADIVLTGRVADAALFLAPLVHEFDWALETARTRAELDRLAQGLVVGHLLECSGQGSGGNFGSLDAWKAIPD